MLYRTYRPTNWDQIVGQEHVVRTLQGALGASRIGHAYLFAGPRGTGKTTIARIWARAVNCTAKKGRPCGTCASCKVLGAGNALDLVEIDAASNRGIDDVRQLKETVATAPALLPYKVFIIDEVHMLSRDAFNALLKMLEEPPAHALFVLATTEPHKILPTVLSRVQRFDFRKLTQAQITAKLRRIADEERLDVEPDALATIAAAADGAVRDAEVMLTKLMSHVGTAAVTAASVQSVLGLVPQGWYDGFTRATAGHDRAGALRMLTDVSQNGADMDHLARGLLEFLRQVMLAKIDPVILASAGLADVRDLAIRALAAELDGAWLVRAITTFTEARTQLRSAAIPTLPLELAVLELAA